MKKRIIIGAFVVLILITAILFLKTAIDSYNYDMDPDNGIDIMQGFGAAMAICLGGFVVFYELDLFYTVYYFVIKPKSVTKSILNVLSNLSLLLIFFTGDLADILYRYISEIFAEETIVTIVLFMIYMVLRCVYLIVSVMAVEDN